LRVWNLVLILKRTQSCQNFQRGIFLVQIQELVLIFDLFWRCGLQCHRNLEILLYGQFQGGLKQIGFSHNKHSVGTNKVSSNGKHFWLKVYFLRNFTSKNTRNLDETDQPNLNHHEFVQSNHFFQTYRINPHLMYKPFLIVFISVLYFSLVFSEVKSQEHTFSYHELMSLPISQLGVNNVSNTMPPIETTKVLSVINVEPENENDTEVTDAESESVSALIKAMSFGSIIKKVLANGWQYFQIKAGVLKNMILTKGKALPENLFNKAKNYVDDIKGTPAQIDQLFQEFRKDGILKVIKHYRTQNLQKVGAFGLIKVTTENVGGKQIVKFSTAEFTKHMAINLFKDLAAKEAEDLAKDFAKEYAEHVFASVVNDEVESETKKFDAIQKIKDFFIPTDLCWKDSYGRGLNYFYSSKVSEVFHKSVQAVTLNKEVCCVTSNVQLEL
jgi:hypothetical protein